MTLISTNYLQLQKQLSALNSEDIKHMQYYYLLLAVLKRSQIVKLLLFFLSCFYSLQVTVQLGRIVALQIHHLITDSSYNKKVKKNLVSTYGKMQRLRMKKFFAVFTKLL